MSNNSRCVKSLSILISVLLGLMNWTHIFARPLKTAEAYPTAFSRNLAEPAAAGVAPTSASGLRDDDKSARARVAEAYGRLPVSFEANLGQTDARVKFFSRGSQYALFLTAAESVLLLNGPVSKDSAKGRRAALRMKFAGANPQAVVEGLDEMAGRVNYFIGKDASRWQTNVPSFARVRYRSIYAGVDLVYYGNRHQIEYDFVVGAGADYRSIRLRIEGATGTRVDASGDLVLTTSVGDVRQRKPFVYQEIGGARREIAARYVINKKGEVAFEVGAYDKTKPLVIDPVLDYSTYLGGTNFDESHAIVLDSNGNAYLTGQTTSFNFPVTISSFDTTYANGTDAFVTKLNAAGTDMVYSTYIGGNSDDNGLGIFIDAIGNAYITGTTSSNDYPTTPGSFQTTFRGGFSPGDGFITKLNSIGTALVYSTYLGGGSSDQGSSIAVDTAGSAYVTGFTFSNDYPTTPGAFQTTFAGGGFPMGDAFITKMNANGSALVYSTFLGGVSSEQGTGIALDSTGRAVITGSTNSADFDVTAGAFQTTFGGSTSTFNALGDAFVTKLNTTGSALVYSTYLGGSSDEGGLDIALNSGGEAFICGSTTSFNLPVTSGVIRVVNGGLAKSTDAASSWGAINAGITDSTILSFAIDPLTPSNVYAGTNSSGIFKSTNGGVAWSPVNSGLTNLTIKSIAIDRFTPSTLYLGTNGRGVFRSTNGGGNWIAINTGQGGSSVNALVQGIDPLNSSVLYAGTDAGAFKSTNGGANWMAINTGLNTNFVHSLAIDPVNTSNLYAGTFSGVYVTRNGGQNWTLSSLNSGTIRALQVDPLTPATIYAGGDGGVFKSTDMGVTWQGVNAGLLNRIVNALAIDPANSSIIYAGTGNGVFKSINGGGAWSASNGGLAGSIVNTLTINPATPATIYAGTAFGSTDGFVARLNPAGTALVYSTYLGGSNFDNSNGIAIDSSSNAFVTGQTNSTNFPTTPATFQSLSSGFDTDAYVTKLNAAATGLLYSTYLGGNSTDQGFGIAANSSGNAYITGMTSSSNFPTTPGAFQTLLGGVPNNFSNDGFVAKLNQAPSLTSDLRLTLTGPSGTITPGTFVSYNISVTNDGPDPAFSIVITDEFSPSLTFNFCNSSFGSCNRMGNTVTFTLNTLAPGATFTGTIFASGSCTMPDGVPVVNTATVESQTPDSNSANNTAMVSNDAFNPGVTLSPMSQTFPASGGTGTVNVTTNSSCSWTAVSNVPWINITFSTDCCNGRVDYSVAANSGVARAGTITIAGKTFTVNQGGTGGSQTIGVYLPSDRTFYLRNSNTAGFADLTIQYGPAGATPVVGDWDGNGTTTIGVFDPATATFYLRNANTAGNADLTIQYGPPGATPLAGNWDGM